MKRLFSLPTGLMRLLALLLLSAQVMPALANERAWGGKVHGKPRVYSRNEWRQAVAENENLILGLPAWFSPAPNWKMTQGKDDPLQLTDGSLSKDRLDDRILYAQDAVGWQRPGPYVILFDLGKPKPVGKFVARFLGGNEHPMIVFPKMIELIASDDGQTFHSVRQLQKLLPGEKELADWKKTFYLEEDGTAYVKTFVLDAGVTARYIGLRVQCPGIFLLSDEMAALKADVPVADLESFPVVSVLMDTVGAKSRAEAFLLTTPYLTPNWLQLEDTRSKKETQSVTLRLELPAEVELVGWGSLSAAALEQASTGDDQGHAWELPLSLDRQKRLSERQGPLYLRYRDPAKPIDTEARLLTYSHGEKTHEVRVPIRSLALPDAGSWPGHHLSLGWMQDGEAMAWPDFHKAYAYLGFNYVPTFPRRFDSAVNEQPGKEFTREEKLEFLARSRAKGFKVIYNESPFHVLRDVKGAKHPEILNEIDGSRGRYLSPIYRGELYREEIARVARHAVEVKADTIFYDIELWHASLNEAKADPRFQEALKVSGKDEAAFVQSLGSEMLRDLHSAIGKAMQEAGLPLPEIGQYNVQAKPPVYHLLFSWPQIYPRWLDFAMPSLYVQGDPLKVRSSIQNNYKVLQKRANIPWLTAGTYGTFAPQQMEWMVYETLLNGASGFTYFAFGDFDPEHFYYHARALKTLNPYQKVLEKGRPEDAEMLAGKGTVSMITTDEEGLLLIGNYGTPASQEVVLKLPFPEIAEVRDLRGGKPPVVADGKMEVHVPASAARLFYFRK